MENKQIPNVSNEKVEEAIKEYAKERTKDNLSKVVNLLRPSGLFVPAMINEEKKPVPFFLKNSIMKSTGGSFCWLTATDLVRVITATNE